MALFAYGIIINEYYQHEYVYIRITILDCSLENDLNRQYSQ